MTHSRRIVWSLFYTAEIDPVQRRDGRFNKSVELGGRAALPDRVGGLGGEIGNGVALWTADDRAGAWPDAPEFRVGIGRRSFP
jgi:hypothetical protein